MKSLILKLISTLLAALLLCPVIVNAGSSQEQQSTCIFSIYDVTKNHYVVDNTKIAIGKEDTVKDLLEYSLYKKWIKQYYFDENNRLQLIQYLIGNVDEVMDDDYGVNVFTYKINGKIIDVSQGNGYLSHIQSGDIVEIIYGNVAEEYTSDSDEIIESSVNNANYWTQEASSAMESGCSWLQKEGGDSDFYLAATGAAGVTASNQAVNDFINNVDKEQANTSTYQRARNVMMLSFCGYTETNDYIKGSLKTLSKQGGIGQGWIDEPIYMIYAYDMRMYQISPDVINTRTAVIDKLLSFQNDDGGFGRYKDSVSSPTFTAKAITALSSYKNRGVVAESMSRAIDFLTGYLQESNSSSTILSETVIALCSANVDIGTLKVARSKSLLDELLEYKNVDGGFSREKGEKSDAPSTEIAVIALASIKKNGNPFILDATAQKSVIGNANSGELSKETILVIVVASAVGVAVVAVTIFLLGRRKYLRKKSEDLKNVPSEKE